jgi:pimeloyl-ACP methyl ester carboxylesterase
MLIGESQGGLVSALTAAQMNKEVSQLVLIYPALCIPDNWNEKYPKVEDIPDTTRMWNVPLGRRYFKEVRGIDPFKTMNKFQKPVLIIQGDADKVVRMIDSERAVKAYKNARLHVIPGAGHGFKPEERKDAIEQIKAFIKK